MTVQTPPVNLLFLTLGVETLLLVTPVVMIPVLVFSSAKYSWTAADTYRTWNENKTYQDYRLRFSELRRPSEGRSFLSL